ncbi:MAG: hypothetical protein WBW71_01000 [Bacteroidota bacterium]
MPRTLLHLCYLLAAFVLLPGCKKNNPVTPPAVDPALVGVWYNTADTVGFEIVSDGTIRNLDVDSTGALQYAPPADTVEGALILTIESARNGAISIQGSYKSKTIDSTYTSTGTYALTNSNSVLTLTLLTPINGAGEVTFIYQRSSIGEIVVRRSTANSSIGSKQ